MSIDQQIEELKHLLKENLVISEFLTEAETASSGRPVFNSLISLIKKS